MPTVEKKKNGVVRDGFYAKLEGVYDKCPAHGVKIVLGDFNAKDRRRARLNSQICSIVPHLTSATLADCRETSSTPLALLLKES